MKPGRHICTACNAIYEEPNEKFDPNKKPFESLPAGWKCQCGAGVTWRIKLQSLAN